MSEEAVPETAQVEGVGEVPDGGPIEEAQPGTIELQVPTADGNDVSGLPPQEQPLDGEGNPIPTPDEIYTEGVETVLERGRVALEGNPLERGRVAQQMNDEPLPDGILTDELDPEDPANAETAQAEPEAVGPADPSTHAFIPGEENPQPEGAYVP